jgi:glycerol-3-phosphate acyltransferase PlsY
MLYLLALGLGYLIGSVSFATLICRARGVDIFSVGSGNPGATNVTRALGGKWGKVCFFLDAMKGFVAAGWPWLVVSQQPGVCEIGGPTCAVIAAAGSAHLYSILGFIGAIVGHTNSLHLKLLKGRFLGGKAVATTMGGLAALTWPTLLGGLLVWVLVFFAFGKIVGLASVAFALSLPLLAWLFGEVAVVIWFLLFLAAFVVYKHRENLQRLIKGEERSFAAQPKDDTKGPDHS